MTYQKFFFFKTKNKKQILLLVRENCVKQCVCYIATFDCRGFFLFIKKLKVGFKAMLVIYSNDESNDDDTRNGRQDRIISHMVSSVPIFRCFPSLSDF